MDGVLADFNKEPNAVERFKIEENFFYKLKPIKSNVNAIKELIKNGFNVYILSASPHERAGIDKLKWLDKYLPQMKKENIIIMRNGENKADFVKTKDNNILLDDYGKNCEDFIKRGYKSLQVKKYHSIKRLLKQRLTN